MHTLRIHTGQIRFIFCHHRANALCKLSQWCASQASVECLVHPVKTKTGKTGQLMTTGLLTSTKYSHKVHSQKRSVISLCARLEMLHCSTRAFGAYRQLWPIVNRNNSREAENIVVWLRDHRHTASPNTSDRDRENTIISYRGAAVGTVAGDVGEGNSSVSAHCIDCHQ